jgi:hypothetical protein
MRYQVVVGNVGTVIDTDNHREAWTLHSEYVELSKNDMGRSSGEDVTTLFNGEIISEYTGKCVDCEGCEKCEGIL